MRSTLPQTHMVCQTSTLEQVGPPVIFLQAQWSCTILSFIPIVFMSLSTQLHVFLRAPLPIHHSHHSKEFPETLINSCTFQILFCIFSSHCRKMTSHVCSNLELFFCALHNGVHLYCEIFRLHVRSR